jgi:uncharacterized membrane protein
MGHGHGHDHLDDRSVAAPVRRALWTATAVCAVLVVLGVIVLWPSGGDDRVDPSGLDADPVAADVTSVEVVPCAFDPILSCKAIEVVPVEGDLEGQRLLMEQAIDSTIDAGDEILVLVDELADGSTIVTFYDFRRGTPMLLLLLVFVAAILVLGRWRGLGALAGLAASLVVIIGFALPALLEGSNPVAVALVAAGVIAFLALFLAHGPNLSTVTALLSTLASLAITGLLAWIFVWTSEFTGLTDESVGYLDALGTPIDPRGLLLAGIVIGALGVLDDVTVTQVSAVWELDRAAPGSPFSDLYRRGVRIGRDHISSTVNTLFLAYAGAALPLLLLFREAGQSIGSVATREIVAVEIVRALVGSIGLIASVPISTALAAKVVTSDRVGVPSGAEPSGEGASDDAGPARLAES